MQVEKRGVFYRLFNFKSASYQTVKFTEKVGGEHIPGTTNEEVVDMLINRFQYLNERNWSPKNELVLELLYVIRKALHQRLGQKINNVNRYKNGTH